jgi:signal transduction histidine kinase
VLLALVTPGAVVLFILAGRPEALAASATADLALALALGMISGLAVAGVAALRRGWRVAPVHESGVSRAQAVSDGWSAAAAREARQGLQTARAEHGALTRYTTAGVVIGFGRALREPLANARACLRAVMRAQRAPAEERRVALHLLDKELWRVQQVLARFVALARLEAHQVSMVREQVDLAALAAQVLAPARRVAAQRAIEIAAETDEPAVVVGDPDRLEQALRALIDHVLRAAPDSGRVLITLRGDAPTPGMAGNAKPHATFAVSYTADQASAVDPEQLFDPFLSQPAGCGDIADRLDMAIVREIARAHGGHVRAEWDAKAGVRLVLILPAAAAAAPGPPRAGDTSSAAPPAARPSLSPTDGRMWLGDARPS